MAKWICNAFIVLGLPHTKITVYKKHLWAWESELSDSVAKCGNCNKISVWAHCKMVVWSLHHPPRRLHSQTAFIQLFSCQPKFTAMLQSHTGTFVLMMLTYMVCMQNSHHKSGSANRKFVGDHLQPSLDFSHLHTFDYFTPSMVTCDKMSNDVPTHVSISFWPVHKIGGRWNLFPCNDWFKKEVFTCDESSCKSAAITLSFVSNSGEKTT